MQLAWIRRLIVGAAVVSMPALAMGQSSLGPVADEVEEPLLPVGISPGDVELFGDRVHVFKAEDGADVVHVVGDFELHLARRRHFAAREAVVWMTAREFQGIEYRHFDVYLWRNARVEQSAGTMTTGPVLFVTLNASGKVTIGADDTSRTASSDSIVYREGNQLRRRLVRPGPDDLATQPPMRVVEPDAARGEQEPLVRPRLYIGPSPDRGVAEVDGQSVLYSIGDVYLYQEEPGGGDALELRADAAILFVGAQPAIDAPPESPDQEALEPPRDLTADGDDAPAWDVGALSGDQPLSGMDIEGVYLEGDVVLTRGERMIRANQLYYDLVNDRALILDAVARAIEPTRDVPVYVRAAQVRQLSRTEYAAWDAMVSTSEFYTPHYHIGAKEIRFTDRTSRSITGVRAGLRAGTFEAYHTTFNLSGTPLLYWPYARGDFKQGESLIQGVRTGYSKDFGGTFESEWHLFNLLGFETPLGFEGTLRLDEFTERGPGVGVDLDYERDDYFGLYRGYFIHDEGEDSLGRFRDEDPPTKERGRSTIRHRQYLPQDWQLTLEASYVTDRGFLEEYFKSEFEEGKEQETLLYLKKQQDTWAFTTLAQTRILDWETQTEHFPDVEFRVIGQPLSDVATWHSENRAGFVRYRPGEREFFEELFLLPDYYANDGSGAVARADTRQEIGIPLTLGPVKLVPFGSIRQSAWDDSPESGGVDRVFGTAGLRASMYLSRVFPDLHSKLLDVDGIRHIIKPDVTAWVSGSNRDRTDLFPFTPNVEDIDDVSGVNLGVRQRWQTRRGGPAQKRVVDLVTLDLELGLFDNAPGDEYTNGFASYSRPENSIARNYLNSAFAWRIPRSAPAMIPTSSCTARAGWSTRSTCAPRASTPRTPPTCWCASTARSPCPASVTWPWSPWGIAGAPR